MISLGGQDNFWPAVTAAEMKRLDLATIQQGQVPAAVLMENAGLAGYRALQQQWGTLAGQRVYVLAGRGNNGGDGYVVARYLQQGGALVTLWEGATDPAALSPETRQHRRAAQAAGVPSQPLARLTPKGLADGLPPALIVDALLGTGLKGTVREPLAQLIAAVNQLGRRGVPVLALDVPSGLDADRGVPLGTAIRAQLTVSFALPKVGLLQGPAVPHTGRLLVVPIGVDTAPAQAAAHLLRPQTVTRWLQSSWPTPALTHKGQGGRCLVVGGARGMGGAALLAAQGALRTGAGLVSVALPAAQSTAGVLASWPEVMQVPLADGGSGSFTAGAAATLMDYYLGRRRPDAAVVGPGLGKTAGGGQGLGRFVSQLLADGVPCVIDADGLNLLAASGPQLLSRAAWSSLAAARRSGRQPPLVLTPHPAEAARLLGWTVADVQTHRRRAVHQLARRWQATVILKGARTLIAGPQGPCFVNPVIEAALAAGGTGDVLAGMVGALLAQGRPPVTAAASAALLHGVAGTLAADGLTGAATGAGAAPVWGLTAGSAQPGPALPSAPLRPGLGVVGAGGTGARPWRRGLLASEVAAAVPRAAAWLLAMDATAEEALLTRYGLSGFTHSP